VLSEPACRTAEGAHRLLRVKGGRFGYLHTDSLNLAMPRRSVSQAALATWVIRAADALIAPESGRTSHPWAGGPSRLSPAVGDTRSVIEFCTI
jgi:hypothetical protein